MSNLFSCLWFNEVDRFTPRDQLSFAYTYQKLRRMNPGKPFYLNMFKVKNSIDILSPLIWTERAIVGSKNVKLESVITISSHFKIKNNQKQLEVKFFLTLSWFQICSACYVVGLREKSHSKIVSTQIRWEAKCSSSTSASNRIRCMRYFLLRSLFLYIILCHTNIYFLMMVSSTLKAQIVTEVLVAEDVLGNT